MMEAIRCEDSGVCELESVYGWCRIPSHGVCSSKARLIKTPTTIVWLRQRRMLSVYGSSTILGLIGRSQPLSATL